MPDDARSPKEVLEDLNVVMDDLIVKMGLWEKRLQRILGEGDKGGLIKEAGRSAYFKNKVDKVRSSLDRSRSQREDPMTGKDLEDLDLEIEGKCDHVSTKVDKAMDEILAMEEELGESIKRAMEQIGDLDIYFHNDE